MSIDSWAIGAFVMLAVVLMSACTFVVLFMVVDAYREARKRARHD